MTAKRTARYAELLSQLDAIRASQKSMGFAAYDFLCGIRNEGIWREGPYRSWEDFLRIEWTLSPKFEEVERAVLRFGRQMAQDLGLKNIVALLRLPEGEAEAKAMARIAQTMAKYGVVPSYTTLLRILREYGGEKPKVVREMSESDRLRKLVRELTAELAFVRTELEICRQSAG
jgi:hypothetical protein